MPIVRKQLIDGLNVNIQLITITNIPLRCGTFPFTTVVPPGTKHYQSHLSIACPNPLSQLATHHWKLKFSSVLILVPLLHHPQTPTPLPEQTFTMTPRQPDSDPASKHTEQPRYRKLHLFIAPAKLVSLMRLLGNLRYTLCYMTVTHCYTKGLSDSLTLVGFCKTIIQYCGASYQVILNRRIVFSCAVPISHREQTGEPYKESLTHGTNLLGLPGVRYLTVQSGILALRPV